MTNEVTRYDCICDAEPDTIVGDNCMVEAEAGEYVRYEAIEHKKTLNTCGTCMHFGSPVKDDEYVPTGYHVCQLINRGDEQCNDIALVVDASGYYAALCIKEEFCCNQWDERKPDQPTSAPSAAGRSCTEASSAREDSGPDGLVTIRSDTDMLCKRG